MRHRTNHRAKMKKQNLTSLFFERLCITSITPRTRKEKKTKKNDRLGASGGGSTKKSAIYEV